MSVDQVHCKQCGCPPLTFNHFQVRRPSSPETANGVQSCVRGSPIRTTLGTTRAPWHVVGLVIGHPFRSGLRLGLAGLCFPTAARNWRNRTSTRSTRARVRRCDTRNGCTSVPMHGSRTRSCRKRGWHRPFGPQTTCRNHSHKPRTGPWSPLLLGYASTVPVRTGPCVQSGLVVS